jgi:hypothetical protein
LAEASKEVKSIFEACAEARRQITEHEVEHGCASTPAIDYDSLPLVIRALEHYGAYLKSINRDGGPYEMLADSLKRKEPAREEPPLFKKARKRA